jgi:hypothetical protein
VCVTPIRGDDNLGVTSEAVMVCEVIERGEEERGREERRKDGTRRERREWSREIGDILFD